MQRLRRPMRELAGAIILSADLERESAASQTQVRGVERAREV
jgi:hypothetical protein